MSTVPPLPALDVQTLTAGKKSFNINKPKDMAALKKVGQDFESMFLSQMLGHMFSGIKAKGMFGGGQAEETYRSLLVEEYGKTIAKAGGIGVAAQVVRSVMLQFQEEGQNVQSRRSAE
jgi:peptidoglycan hydrolase FlgJ